MKEVSTAQVNFNGRRTHVLSAPTVLGEDRKKTTPVGMFEPNAFGLYDMHGNVSEWCLDYFGAMKGGKNPVNDQPYVPKINIEKNLANNRIARGGCYYLSAPACRAAARPSYDPNQRNSAFGFRILMVVQP